MLAIQLLYYLFIGKPKPPEIITATAITETTLHVRWSPAKVDGILLRYLVYYRVLNSNLYSSVTISHGKTKTNLTNLIIDEVYQIYIVTVDNFGASEPSHIVHASTSMIISDIQISK